MSRRKAERFDEAWEQVAQGGVVKGPLAPLVETAQRATVLAEPPPPPPNRLSPGRQRFLAEAARLRTENPKPRKERVQLMGTMKLATALTVAVLLIGMVIGVGPAAADSLPGEYLYNMKLFAEQARLALTSDPQARAELGADLAAERLDEIAALMEQGQAIGQATQERAESQMRLALGEAIESGELARTRMLQRLDTMLQERLQKMAALADEAPQPTQLRVRLLLREMERVREEAHAGQGDPDGERQRLRQGTPPATPPGEQKGPQPAEEPGQGSGPKATDKPAGPQPTEDPGQGPGPQPTDKPAGPQPTEDPGQGPGPQPTDKPAGPQPTEDPGQGPGPQPTDKPAGPQPTEDPGQGPGPQPTDEPGGPNPTEDPGQGPGPQPADESGQGSATGPASAPPSGGDDGGNRKP